MSWICYVLAIAWLLDALRMRVRLAMIPVLAPGGNGASPSNRFVTIPGIKVDDATREAASAYASARNVELLDLMPADTPTLVALMFSQLVDPKTYRMNRVAVGCTTGYAVLASEDLLERARVAWKPVCAPAELPRLVRNLKRFAGQGGDFAIAPALKATADNLSSNWQVWEASIAGNGHALFLIRLIMLALLVAGVARAPVAGLAALAVFHLQPLLVFAGSNLRPRDLWLMVLLRGPVELWNWFRTLYSRLRSPNPRVAMLKARRPYYSTLLASDIGRFFEPRREDCPLCGSRNLKVRVRNRDLIQQKPGRFTLEQCSSCGHTFQNPRLSPAGLDFYYCDFYDGLGGSVAETMFRSRPHLYENRARVVEGLATPARWLDVGTGQGHFCAAARAMWPTAEFDGLDISEGIDEAVRAGWVNRGYRGFFSAIATDLKGFYDVLSMFHCLEHTPDLRREIAAAHTALAPGGLLVLEMPNPECVFGRLFGRFWLPWFQPQHLNMPSIGNLETLLQAQGFEVVRVQLAEAHIPIDFFSAIMLFLGSLSRKPNLPWHAERARWFDYARDFTVWTAGFPVILAAIGVDLLVAPICRRMRISNAYRIVARRLGEPEEVLTQRRGDAEENAEKSSTSASNTTGCLR